MAEVNRRDLGVRRPMLALALALGLGQLLGMVTAFGSPVGLAGVSLMAAVGLRRFGGALGLPLVLLFALSFVRSSAVDSGASPDGPRFVAHLDLEQAHRTRAHVGIWRAGNRPTVDGLEQWSLSRARPRNRAGEVDWEAPVPELAKHGEVVALLPSSAPQLRADGTAPGPWARDAVWGSVFLTPDAIRRLEPARRSIASWVMGPMVKFASRLTHDGGRSYRDRLIERSRSVPAGLPPGLLSALLFGAKGEVDPEAKDLFTRTGTRHLLAISGLHVGLLAAFLILPLARALSRLLAMLFRTRHANREARFTAPIAILLVLIFVPLAGAGSPVLRASAALVLALAAPHLGRLGRRPDGLNLWGTALCLELIASPNALGDLSTRLSYLAALGLLLTLGLLSRSMSRGQAPPLRIRPPSWTSLLAGRCMRSLRFGLAASLAAVWLTLPVTWSTFGEFAPIGILITPLAIPLVAWILTLAWPLVLLGPLLEALVPGLAGELAETLIAPAAKLLGALLWSADTLPGTPVVLPPRPVWLLILATLAGVLALVRAGRNRRSGAGPRPQKLAVLASTLGALLLLPWSLAPRSAQVHIMDVGHGTGSLIRLPSGEIWIFDAGSRDRLRTAAEALLPQLAQWDGPNPNYVLSHNDLDHRSALSQLIPRHPPKTWTGHLPQDLAPALPKTCKVRDHTSGSLSLAQEPGASITLLRGTDLPGNEGSRTLVLDSDKARILLWGDAEAQGLQAMLPLLKSTSKPTYLLLPHHGSDSPHITSLLNQTQPIQTGTSTSSPAQLTAELHRRNSPPSQTHTQGPLCWPAPHP
jgi:ComEC/Rec2-related protein